MHAETDAGIGRSVSSLVLIVGALTLFRLWAAARMGLAPDETYYWLWSRFPSIGYYDHPPMIAWWISASTRLLGDSALGIRAPVVLSMLVTTMGVYCTAVELGLGRRIAGLAALWLNAMFLMGGLALIATPDSPSVMFWALAVWALARLRRTENPLLWIVVGLLAGLGCVSKYTNLFMGLGLVTWCVADRNARRWLASPWLYAGGLAALAVFLPIIVWNEGHQWVSFHKQFGRIDDGGFTLRYLGEFLAGQAGLLNPLIAVFYALALAEAFRGSNKDGRAPVLFLGSTIGPLLLYMLFHSLHDRVQGNWPAPAYPAIAILAAMSAASVVRSKFLRRMAHSVAPIGIGGLAIASALLATSVGATLPWRTPADLLLGWSRLTEQVERYRQQVGAGWIATTDYGLTGELAFHSAHPGSVQEIIDRERYTFQPRPPSLAQQPALVLIKEKDVARYDLGACFRSVTPLAVIARPAGARIIEKYHLFEATGAANDILTEGCQPKEARPIQ
ncbi:MAG: glycosyltransferase family 39 protein [Rhizobiales bacterium]|nr:glycosyltransferase family 39 protein [Hyphomicrobiales bacterium]